MNLHEIFGMTEETVIWVIWIWWQSHDCLMEFFTNVSEIKFQAWVYSYPHYCVSQENFLWSYCWSDIYT